MRKQRVDTSPPLVCGPSGQEMEPIGQNRCGPHFPIPAAAHLPSTPTCEGPRSNAPNERLNAAKLTVPCIHASQGRTSLDVEQNPLVPKDPLTAGSVIVDGKPPPSEERIDWIMASLLFLFPALGGLLFGYDIGATSGALLSITSPQVSGTDWYSLSAFQSGLVVSMSLAGALLGSGGALVFGDKMGRKRELLLAAGLYGEKRFSNKISFGWRSAALQYQSVDYSAHRRPASHDSILALGQDHREP